MSAGADRTGEARGNMVSPGLRAGGIAAVFVAMTFLLEIEWERLSPVHSVSVADSRALKLRISHEDGANATLATALDADGLHLTGSGFRGPGARVEIPNPPAEHDCPLGVPHVHAAPTGPDDFVISLEARSRRRGSALAIGIGSPTLVRYAKRMRWHPPVGLDTSFREIRVPVDAMLPKTRSPASAAAIAVLALEFDPPVAVDASVRNIRLLRVPAER